MIAVPNVRRKLQTLDNFAEQAAGESKGGCQNQRLCSPFPPHLALDVIEMDGSALAELFWATSATLINSLHLRKDTTHTYPFHTSCASRRQKLAKKKLPTLGVQDAESRHLMTVTRALSLAVVVATIIRLQVNMLKLSSVVRPGLAHATRITPLSNRWIASATGAVSSIPPPVDDYTLPSGDNIPSVGLGTWRMSGEDAGEAVKVVPEELFDQGNPDSQL